MHRAAVINGCHDLIGNVSMGDRTLREQIVIDEIAGKNAAIHAYDQIIWVARTGFLTLFFAGWALLLRALAEDCAASADAVKPYIPIMLIISTGLTVGGMVVDLNYVVRKFRVIASLNKLMEIGFRYADQLDTLPKEKETEVFSILQVTGEGETSSCAIPEGRRTAIIAALTVYIIPFICLALSWWLVGFEVTVCNMEENVAHYLTSLT